MIQSSMCHHVIQLQRSIMINAVLLLTHHCNFHGLLDLAHSVQQERPALMNEYRVPELNVQNLGAASTHIGVFKNEG